MREKLATMLWGAVLAFTVSFSAVACVVTGFSMSVELGTVALWCGIAAVLGAVCYATLLHPVPIAAWSVTAAILWITGDLEKSVRALLYRVSRQYDSAYGWGIIRLEHYTAGDLEPMLGMSLCFIGVLIAMAVAWAVCRRRSAAPGILTALLCLAACLVVTNTVPHVFWLYCLLFGILLLMLTHTVRREDTAGGNRLSAMAALPLALLLLVLFVAVPQSSYTGQDVARTVVNAVLKNELVQEVFGDLGETGTSGSSVSSGIVRLDAVGVRLQSQSEMLQIHTDFSGVVYLRGRALDTYDGLTWTDSGESTPALYWPSSEILSPQGEVTVQTRYAHKMLYLPYYVKSMDLRDVSRGVENTKSMTQYSFTTAGMPDAATLAAAEIETQQDFSQYLHLSESVKKWAEPLAQQLAGDKTTVYQQAQAIAAYVRRSASYDLKTESMPARSNDFVRWFLETGDTGYCVHFASSAVVLLQAAGIPARYVTGYMTPVGKDCYTTVREEDAHAWAEYWLPGFGWAVLEATPSAQAAPEEEAPVTTPSEPPMELDWRRIGVIAAAILLTGFVGIFVQRFVRLHLRRRKLRMGSLKERVLAHWQEATLFARCLGGLPDDRLFTIAQRVKFSQHPAEEQDLAPFVLYLQDARAQLKRHAVWRKLYYRFVLALF